MARRIQQYDWGATPLGRIERWPQSLKTSVQLMLASGHAMQLAWGPERTVLYNDAYAPMLGGRHPEALGVSFRAAWPDIWDEIEPLVARVFAGDTVRFENMPLMMTRRGYPEETWWNFSYSPVREESGAVAGLLNVTVDATAQMRAERAERERDEANVRLREHEERLRALVNASSDVVYTMSPDWSEMHQLDGRSFVPETKTPSVKWIDDYLFPEDRSSILDVIGKAIASKSVFELEHRVRRPDESAGWTFSRAIPVFNGVGEITQWFGMAADITAHHQSKILLAAQKEAFRNAMNGAPLATSLGILTQAAIEQSGDDRRCAFYIADRDGAHRTHVVGMGDACGAKIEGFEISPESLACGLAVASGKPVFTTDVQDEPRWHQLSWPATEIDYRGCWSFPVETATGKLVGSLAMYFTEPREPTQRDRDIVAALTSTAAIIISEHQATTALRESEEGFRQFAASSSDALWIRDAVSFKFEYVSDAVTAIFGVSPAQMLADDKLLNSLIIPEERDAVSQRVERIAKGERISQEYRILRPSDRTFRWIRSTGFPLRDERGEVRRIGAIASDITEAKLAIEHQAILLAELQHRVRNIMAMMRSITARSGERAVDVPDYAGLVSGRLLALARVQALLTRAANIGVGVAAIVRDEVSAQAQHDRQYVLDGPDIELSPKAAEILTLVVHELATNAVKYGALSVADGKVLVRWDAVEKRGAPWLVFDWTEGAAPDRQQAASGSPVRRGFGTELIEGRVPYELGGLGQILIGPGGAHCHLAFPLRDGASVLETDAPQHATVFGGALDMTGEADLSGHRILVVEDDYYQATDTARALQGAGAMVLGPYPNEEAARAEIEGQHPDAALLDVNLGAGPAFELAGLLTERGVPFVFLTGYDQDAIPKEFGHIERLEKPVELRLMVSAIAKIVARDSAPKRSTA